MFKGELVSLLDIPPGTPVELPEGIASLGNSKVGILLGANQQSGSACYPDVEVVVKKVLSGDTLELRNGFMVPAEGKWKVLTGKAGEAALALRKKSYPGLRLPYSGFTIGADPEIFVKGKDGNVLHAWSYLRKKNPLTTAMAIAFWDGPQAEWCPAPRTCLAQLQSGIWGGMFQDIIINARRVDPQAKLTIQNTIQLSPDILQNELEEHIAFGCSPSLNIYSDSQPILINPRAYPYRFAGGHIHAGVGKLLRPQVREIMMALDGIVGVMGVSLAEGIDTPERRTMYGKAGEFRLPKHGLEYRVLSNFWLCDPSIYMLVFEMFRQALKIGRAGLYSTVWDANQDEVIEVINSCDVKGARKILKRNVKTINWMLDDRFPTAGHQYPKIISDFGTYTILNGMAHAVKDPEAIQKNWERGLDTWQNLSQRIGASAPAVMA